MKYLHTMIRIKDVDESLRFFCKGLGLKETRRIENEKGRFTLIFLAAPNDNNAEIELTYNWDGDELGNGSRNFGHLAYRADNIYETCQRLMDMGYTINRPPRDGHMAFVRSPDQISIEILQEGNFPKHRTFCFDSLFLIILELLLSQSPYPHFLNMEPF